MLEMCRWSDGLADARGLGRSRRWSVPPPCPRAWPAPAVRADRSGHRGARRSSICATTSGSRADPPRATCRTASAKLSRLRDAPLEQVADAFGALAEQLQRVALPDVLGEHEDARRRAARRGSSSPRARPRRCGSEACGCPSRRRRGGARRPARGAPRRRSPRRRRRTPPAPARVRRRLGAGTSPRPPLRGAACARRRSRAGQLGVHAGPVAGRTRHLERAAERRDAIREPS